MTSIASNYIVVRSAVSKKQLELMVSFIEEHPEIAKNKVTENFTAADRKKVFEELALHLNAEGPCKKPPEKWSKTWSDYKCNVKKKASEIKSSMSGTGGESSSEKKLTLLEERVLALIGETAITGMVVVPDFDEPSECLATSEVSEEALGLEMELPFNCDADPPATEPPTPDSGKRKWEETSSLPRKREVTGENVFPQQELLIESNRAIDPPSTESTIPVYRKRKQEETSSLPRKSDMADEDICHLQELLIESNRAIAENLRLLADRTLEGQRLIAEMTLEGQKLQAETTVKSAEIISNALLALAQAVNK